MRQVAPDNFLPQEKMALMLPLGKVVGGVRGCETQSSSVSGSSMVSGHSFTHLTSFFPLNQQSKIPSDNKCAVLL